MTEDENREDKSLIKIVQYGIHYCKYCGNKLQDGAAFCSSCGRPQNNNSVRQISKPVRRQQPAYAYMDGMYQQSQSSLPNIDPHNGTTVVVQGNTSNGLGTAGFILALLSLVFCWVPWVNIILWLLGLIFSFVGLFISPRGFAIAGFILSFIGIIAIYSIMGSIVAFLSSL